MGDDRNPRPSGRGTLRITFILVNGRRLSVEKVVHHDDIFSIVIRTRRCIASYDLHSSHTSIAKDNADEGQVSVARRSRRIACEKQLAAGAVVLDQRAGEAVSCPISQAAAIRGVTPKPVEVAGVLPLLPGTENSTTVTLLPIGEKRRSGLNAWKIVA